MIRATTTRATAGAIPATSVSTTAETGPDSPPSCGASITAVSPPSGCHRCRINSRCRGTTTRRAITATSRATSPRPTSISSTPPSTYKPASPLDSSTHFHHNGDCPFNGTESQSQIETCDLVGLDDLDHSNSTVSNYPSFCRASLRPVSVKDPLFCSLRRCEGPCSRRFRRPPSMASS